MDNHSKLSEHDFVKGVFQSKLSQIVTPLDKEEAWSYAKVPEHIWLALILYGGYRETQLNKSISILKELHNIKPTDQDELFTMSKILSLSDDKKSNFIAILKDHGVLEKLAPLSLLSGEEFHFLRSEIKTYQYSITDRVEKLNNVLGEVSDHQSQLSTDIRYLIIYQANLKSKLVVRPDSNIIDDLNSYPYLDEQDEKMRITRPLIRSMEIGISQTFSDNSKLDNNFSPYFWKEIGRYTDCEVFSVSVSEDKVDLKPIENELYRILKYYRDVIQNLEQNDSKLFVLAGILTYSYKRVLELTEHDLQQTISGRSIVRSVVENYMMTKYLLKNEHNHKNIWEEYQYYGIGNYKLIYERYREDSLTIDDSHVRFDYINLLTSEYINKEFLEMDTRYFGKGNIRKKFKEVDEDSLYKYLYEYDTQFEHGLWGAIRESSVLKCDSPGHQFHGIPDIDNIQKMPDVGNDIIKVLRKHIDVILDAYPVPFTSKEKEGGSEK